MADAAAAAAWPKPPRYYLEPRREPPAPPPAGAGFRMFGVQRPPLGALPPLPPLEDQVHTASNDEEAIAELRRLNKVLLARFVDLLRTMQAAPTQTIAKVGEIRNLMLNLQHLLNSLRGFEAREELISIVQAQVDAKRELVDALRKSCEECKSSSTLDAMEIEQPDAAVPQQALPGPSGSSSSSSSAPPGASSTNDAARKVLELLAGGTG